MSEKTAVELEMVRAIHSATDGHWYVSFSIGHHNYRATAPHWTEDEANAEVSRLRAAPEVAGPENWRELLTECADDLEAELLDRYGHGKAEDIHPAMRPKFDRDMEPVRKARAILRTPEPVTTPTGEQETS